MAAFLSSIEKELGPFQTQSRTFQTVVGEGSSKRRYIVTQTIQPKVRNPYLPKDVEGNLLLVMKLSWQATLGAYSLWQDAHELTCPTVRSTPTNDMVDLTKSRKKSKAEGEASNSSIGGVPKYMVILFRKASFYLAAETYELDSTKKLLSDTAQENQKLRSNLTVAKKAKVMAEQAGKAHVSEIEARFLSLQDQMVDLSTAYEAQVSSLKDEHSKMDLGPAYPLIEAALASEKVVPQAEDVTPAIVNEIVIMLKP
ncbi:hypothetical protein FNV43_RR15008 [Rhamnella rubrinervis]|uniref:Uncharacterized protein n=1 Tax=Rhamnella rubrinervis TaxID=2594499 RepID=A0A8K0E5M0_9ROSA|nr:hypothetical protein FNV43_RR15008 [Rhamnella rubrinervis]